MRILSICTKETCYKKTPLILSTVSERCIKKLLKENNGLLKMRLPDMGISEKKQLKIRQIQRYIQNNSSMICLFY